MRTVRSLPRESVLSFGVIGILSFVTQKRGCRLLPSAGEVNQLVAPHVRAVGERLGTPRERTLVGPFARVRAKVARQRALFGKSLRAPLLGTDKGPLA